MTAPVLVTSREALRAVIEKYLADFDTVMNVKVEAQGLADALAGVVRTPESLPEDEASLRARVEAELDYAEVHGRHIANDEHLVETGVIRAALSQDPQ